MPALESLAGLQELLKDIQRTLETTQAKIREDPDIPEQEREAAADLFSVQRCVTIEYLGKSRDEGETIKLRPAEFLTYDASGYYRLTCQMPPDEDGHASQPPEVWNGKHVRGDDEAQDYKDRNTSTALENAKAHAVSLETVSAQLLRQEHTNRRITRDLEQLQAEKLAWTLEKSEMLATIGSLEVQIERLQQQSNQEDIRWSKIEGGLFDTLRGIAEGMGFGGAGEEAPSGKAQPPRERTAAEVAADDLVQHVRRNPKTYNYLLRNGARPILLRLPPPIEPKPEA